MRPLNLLLFVNTAGLLIVTLVNTSLSDAAFDNLIAQKKYAEAVEYADEKIVPADRDGATWIKLGEAYQALGMNEKALACFLVSWRMNQNDYDALLGAARAYNRMAQYDNAVTMSKKALDIRFTAEAGWEYASACIALGRPAEAKKAMEKVLQTDSSNTIAVRELSNIPGRRRYLYLKYYTGANLREKRLSG